ncbi:unnamed protein product [Cunninghamella blakesleeana]
MNEGMVNMPINGIKQYEELNNNLEQLRRFENNNICCTLTTSPMIIFSPLPVLRMPDSVEECWKKAKCACGKVQEFKHGQNAYDSGIYAVLICNNCFTV